jgi:hypothetical protein
MGWMVDSGAVQGSALLSAAPHSARDEVDQGLYRDV